MEPSELRSLLNDGIQAVRAHDRTRARERLLRVLEADENNEAAWLWLSAALDDPADQLMALERVLAINPQHPQAMARAQTLRQRLGQPVAPPTRVPGTETESETSIIRPQAETTGTVVTILASSPPMAADSARVPSQIEVIMPDNPAASPSDTLLSEDDPYQCAYCGRQTHPDDERCRYCGRSLLGPGQWRGGGYLYFALLVAGVQLQLSLIQALAAFVVGISPRSLALLPFGSLWVSHLLIPAVLRTVAWAIVVLLMLGDFEGGFGVAALVAAVDLAWAGIGYQLGVVPSAAAQINAALGVVIFLIGLLAVISQAQSRVRLRVVLDRNLDGAVMLHRRALAYARQGKWALAALHWRRAISRSPSEGLYYKSLGRANVALGRYAEAVRAFKSGAEVAPADREFSRLIETVRAHTRSS